VPDVWFLVAQHLAKVKVSIMMRHSFLSLWTSSEEAQVGRGVSLLVMSVTSNFFDVFDWRMVFLMETGRA